VGSAHYSDEDEVFHGKLEGIRDLVTFEATQAAGLKKRFQEAVDDYLKWCEVRGRTPDTPYKGTFNVRVGPDLHKRAAIHAATSNKKLNAIVTEALERYLAPANLALPQQGSRTKNVAPSPAREVTHNSPP
jgi:predicted HicB family RNase H-like nuclease